MIYVTSDLHGYPIEKIKKKLIEIGFGEQDQLYILGDCIDRGTDGLETVRWIMSQPNVTFLLGNHEAMLLERNSYCVWTSNGGYATIDSIQQYANSQIKHIFRFLEKAPLYKEIEVDGKKFILTHSGLGSFEQNKPLSEYSRFDLVWTRSSLSTRYYDDGRIVIFGHSPTVLFGSEFRGKPIFTDTWINIDVGAGIRLQPLILRLDDMKLFYI